MAKPLHDHLPPELLALVEKREAGERRQKDASETKLSETKLPDTSVGPSEKGPAVGDEASPEKDPERRYRKRRSAD